MSNKGLRVAVTGGIGSGKSTVCRVIEQVCGGRIYYADTEAKRLMHENEGAVREITRLFGGNAYIDGRLNTRFIAEKVFADKCLLSALNAVIHPLVFEDFDRWAVSCSADGGLVFMESALVIESGWTDRFDKTVVVTAPEDIRISRVMRRDGVGREQVIGRIRNQMEECRRLEYADYMIVCDEKKLMIPQVICLCSMLKAL